MLDGFPHGIAFCEVGGNSGGEGAACAVGVGSVRPGGGEPGLSSRGGPEEVVGLVDLVPALAEDGAAVNFPDGPGGPDHILRAPDGQPG